MNEQRDEAELVKDDDMWYRIPEYRIPEDVREAALKVGNWMKMNGHINWKLYDIQNRIDP